MVLRGSAEPHGYARGLRESLGRLEPTSKGHKTGEEAPAEVKPPFFPISDPKSRAPLSPQGGGGFVFHGTPSLHEAALTLLGAFRLLPRYELCGLGFRVSGLSFGLGQVLIS